MSRYLALIVHRSFGLAKAEPQQLAEIQQPLSVEEEGRRREDVSGRNGGLAAADFFSLSLSPSAPSSKEWEVLLLLYLQIQVEEIERQKDIIALFAQFLVKADTPGTDDNYEQRIVGKAAQDVPTILLLGP